MKRRVLFNGGEIRSASPAKRRASDMTVLDESVPVESTQDETPNEEQDLNKAAKRTSKDLAGQNVREGSVDMLDSGTSDAVRELQNGTTSTGTCAVEGVPASEMPSIDEQVTKVTGLMVNAAWMKEGQKGYIISYKWLSKVMSRSSDSSVSGRFSKEAREGEIGPVDNSDLWLDTDASNKFKDEKGEDFVFIKPNLQLNEDYELVPPVAWDMITKWHGMAEGSPTITRYCHNTSTSEVQDNFVFELSPPVFSLLKLPDRSQGISTNDLKERDAKPVKILASRSEKYQTFLKRAKALVGIDVQTKVRLWRILEGLGDSDGVLTPAQSRSTSPAPGSILTVDPGKKLVLDVNSFAQLQIGSQRESVDAKDETSNQNYNGSSNLGIYGLSSDGVYVLEEMIGGPAGGEWVSDAATTNAKTNGVPVSVTKSGTTIVKDTLKPSSASSRGASPAPTGIMTRGRQAKQGRSRGTVGLTNLGNSCYMNSALQCVRSVEELTEYFLRDKYKPELNPSNPLSHNGDVARQYGKLMHDIYEEKQSSSFTPRNFKNIIGRYGPSFSGYQQQDSQEFLLFLLDGLQEDLNRIHKKPYIEKPDSTDEMVNDPVALTKMADQCWEIYKKRNDSVITDLFAGMYKSTLVCPVCDKVSIIFDPFNNLTLQLPIQNIWSKDVWFFPMRCEPFQVAVDIDKNSSWSSLASYIAEKLNVDHKKLIMAEIWQHKFYKMFDPKKSINEDNIVDNDHIACFELEGIPTNWPAPKKPKQKSMVSFYSTADEDLIPEEDDSPLADRMLVSVFHRRSKSNSRYSSSSKEFFATPSLMILTREEARDYDSIMKKCLSRVETLTTRPFLKEEENATPAEDSDTVVLNIDDSSDSKIHAESLESEDGMVDISNKEDTDRQPKFKRRPLSNALKPGGFIPPPARELFEMRAYSSGSEMVPLALQTYIQDDDKKMPTLSSRLSELNSDELEQDLPSITRYHQRLNRSSGDSPITSDEEVTPVVRQAPSTDDGSESDGLPEVEQVIQQPIRTPMFNGPSKGHHRIKTYGSKGKRKSRFNNFRGKSPVMEKESSSRQSLVRLGEAIVLDWHDMAFDALFGGSTIMDEDEGPVRGQPTWDDLPHHPDPLIEESRRIRAQRRKNGFALADCLDEFGKSEILSESDTWYCPRCKEHRRASKTFELWKAPDILVIHLKRFSAQGRFNNKLDVMVDFPLEGLDLTSRLATQPEEGKPPLYDLFAVDNHYGGLGGGHYTAFAKNFIDEQWYEYNGKPCGSTFNKELLTF